MGVGVSILLIAAGAVLIWAVNASISGVELDVVGWIVFVVGVVGLLVALVASSSMPWRRNSREERVVVDR